MARDDHLSSLAGDHCKAQFKLTSIPEKKYRKKRQTFSGNTFIFGDVTIATKIRPLVSVPYLS